MSSQFQFLGSSPTKQGWQPPSDALTPASDLIQAWGTKESRGADSILSTPGEQVLSAKVSACRVAMSLKCCTCLCWAWVWQGNCALLQSFAPIQPKPSSSLFPPDTVLFPSAHSERM